VRCRQRARARRGPQLPHSFRGPTGAVRGVLPGCRYLCCLAATGNMLLLMAANMIGFVFGGDGIKPFLSQVLGQPHFVWMVSLAYFSGAQLQFALRDWEAHKAAQLEVLVSKQ